MHKDELSLKDIILFLSLIGMLISLVMMVGTAGAVECDKLTILEGAMREIVWVIILILSGIGIIKIQKEEESEFDNL